MRRSEERLLGPVRLQSLDEFLEGGCESIKLGAEVGGRTATTLFLAGRALRRRTAAALALTTHRMGRRTAAALALTTHRVGGRAAAVIGAVPGHTTVLGTPARAATHPGAASAPGPAGHLVRREGTVAVLVQVGEGLLEAVGERLPLFGGHRAIAVGVGGAGGHTSAGRSIGFGTGTHGRRCGRVVFGSGRAGEEGGQGPEDDEAGDAHCGSHDALRSRRTLRPLRP